MSDEVYRLLLVTAYMMQITLVSFVPFGIGNALVVVHLCWMYSLEYRLKYFEKHWAYFLGFGLPAVCLSLFFPKFISLGIFALTFPIFIILAIIAHPTTHVHKKKDAHELTDVASSSTHVDTKVVGSTLHPPTPTVLLPHLPIFRIATWINWWLLSQLQRRSKAASRRPSMDAGGGKPATKSAATNGASITAALQ
jgi:hypothetical protein